MVSRGINKDGRGRKGQVEIENDQAAPGRGRKYPPGARSKFWGCQGRRTGVAVTTVPNSLILGGWVTKILKNGNKK